MVCWARAMVSVVYFTKGERWRLRDATVGVCCLGRLVS